MRSTQISFCVTRLAVVKKLLNRVGPSPDRFSAGQYFRTFVDTALMRFEGMRFPANGSRINRAGLVGSGRVVFGSKTVICFDAGSSVPLKSPTRCAAVGTVPRDCMG